MAAAPKRAASPKQESPPKLDDASVVDGPESHEAWASSTNTLLSSAQCVTSQLFEAIEGTERVHADSPKLGNSGRPRNVDRGPRAQKQLDGRLEVTKAALDSVEASVQRCATILQLLTHERQAKWAALKVVEWRLALRERRPTSELFRDHLQEVLEQEKRTLEDSRRILEDRSAEGRIANEDCEANKARLMRCVRYMICAGCPNPPLLDNTTSAAEGPGSAQLNGDAEQPIATEEGVTGEAAYPSRKRPEVPTDTEGLIKRAPLLHESSHLLYSRGEKLIQHQRVVCERANEKVMASFRKRNAENKELKLGLEDQMGEMEEAMGIAEKSISRMKKDIEFFGKVALQPKVDSTSALVEKIRAAKQTLQEDLLRKVVSMRIDDCCRKITADRTGQPPESMPVASLLEGTGTKGKIPTGRKRQQTLSRNQSSPAVVKGNSIDSASTLSNTAFLDSAVSTATTMLPRPASPAGISSSLKAAAMVSLAT